MKIENIHFTKVPVGASNSTGQVGLISLTLNDIQLNGIKVFEKNRKISYLYPEFTDVRGTRYNAYGIINKNLYESVQEEMTKEVISQLERYQDAPLPAYHRDNQ